MIVLVVVTVPQLVCIYVYHRFSSGWPFLPNSFRSSQKNTSIKPVLQLLSERSKDLTAIEEKFSKVSSGAASLADFSRSCIERHTTYEDSSAEPRESPLNNSKADVLWITCSSQKSQDQLTRCRPFVPYKYTLTMILFISSTHNNKHLKLLPLQSCFDVAFTQTQHVFIIKFKCNKSLAEFHNNLGLAQTTTSKYDHVQALDSWIFCRLSILIYFLLTLFDSFLLSGILLVNTVYLDPINWGSSVFSVHCNSGMLQLVHGHFQQAGSVSREDVSCTQTKCSIKTDEFETELNSLTFKPSNNDFQAIPSLNHVYLNNIRKMIM